MWVTLVDWFAASDRDIRWSYATQLMGYHSQAVHMKATMNTKESGSPLDALPSHHYLGWIHHNCKSTYLFLWVLLAVITIPQLLESISASISTRFNHSHWSTHCINEVSISTAQLGTSRGPQFFARLLVHRWHPNAMRSHGRNERHLPGNSRATHGAGILHASKGLLSSTMQVSVFLVLRGTTCWVALSHTSTVTVWPLWFLWFLWTMPGGIPWYTGIQHFQTNPSWRIVA